MSQLPAPSSLAPQVRPRAVLAGLLWPLALLAQPRTAWASSLAPLAAAGTSEPGDSAKTLQAIFILLAVVVLIFMVLKWIYLLRKVTRPQLIIGPPPPPPNWRPEEEEISRPGQPTQVSDPPAAAN